jgi:hypothetical protein
MMTEERMAELVEDVKAHGLVKPIEIYQNQIIDGRNRLEACMRAGITPHYKDVSSEVDGDPRGYVASVNLKRRDLTKEQRAAIIAELARLPVGANQHRKEGVSNDTASPPTLDQAAKLAGVSRVTVARAKKRMRDDPEAHKAAKEGRKLTRPKPPTPTPAPPSAQTFHCSFCGKSQHEVRKLIAGPSVFVCDECLELCIDCIAQANIGPVVRRSARETVAAIIKNFTVADVEKIANLLTQHVQDAENRRKPQKQRSAPTSCAQDGAGEAIGTLPPTSVSPVSSEVGQQ